MESFFSCVDESLNESTVDVADFNYGVGVSKGSEMGEF
jgi:hypothetical protein